MAGHPLDGGPAAIIARATATVTTAPDTHTRKLQHDIQHQLATIMVLAQVVGGAADVGPDSRTRIHQLMAEVRWLEELVRAYDPLEPPTIPRQSTGTRLVRIDAVADEVVATQRLAGTVELTFLGSETWVQADRLALWRALRNLLDNACRAAGPTGRVLVRAGVEGGQAVVRVDDDGPGPGAGPAGSASLGLHIVREVAAGHGGAIRIGTGALGGCGVRFALPAVTPDGGHR